MSRRKRVTTREVTPDPIYHEKLISKFIANLMKGGKKGTAERIMYDAIDLITKRTKKEGVQVFLQAVENAKPPLEVRSRRVGGSTYQVPVEVRADRQQALAIRWLINYATAGKEKTMAAKLATELIAAANKEGATIKKREDTLKMAEANRAFAHFRW